MYDEGRSLSSDMRRRVRVSEKGRTEADYYKFPGCPAGFGPLLLSVLKRAIDLAHKSVGLHASMSPTRVEVCCGMFGQDLTLGSTPIDRMSHTIANGHDHISESFDARPVRHIPSRRHDTESAV